MAERVEKVVREVPADSSVATSGREEREVSESTVSGATLAERVPGQ